MFKFIYLLIHTLGKIRVKCNQTGKLFSVKVSTLCREDGDPLRKKDLVEGTQLVMTLNKKPYTVTFQDIISPLGSQPKGIWLNLLCCLQLHTA